MRINRAIGLGIGILVLNWLMADVFVSLQDTILAALDLGRTAIDVAEQNLAATPSLVPLSTVSH
jgi:hypothetical protein